MKKAKVKQSSSRAQESSKAKLYSSGIFKGKALELRNLQSQALQLPAQECTKAKALELRNLQRQSSGASFSGIVPRQSSRAQESSKAKRSRAQECSKAEVKCTRGVYLMFVNVVACQL
jgi:hypothetical protein